MRQPSRTIGWRTGLHAAAATALLAGVGVAAATTAYAATGCRVDYSVAHQWPGGFTATVGLTNLGDPVDGWELAWTFPDGQQVTDAWNAAVTTTGGRATATDLGYNAAVPTGGTVSFGFNGSWAGSNEHPATFTLNGTACTGDVEQTTPPPTTVPPPTTPPAAGDAMATVAAMQPGWNLGNSLDAVGGDETAWGNPRITQELIAGVSDQGFNSIRVPVTWGDHQGPAPDYTIDPERLDRVEQVVEWALAEDLYVLIDIHHDSWQWIADMPGNRAQVLDRYDAIWTQVAETFRDAPPELLFESVNEPTFTGSSGDAENAALLDELNTSFHRIVRASGGGNATRLLVLPTLHTSADQPRLDELNATLDSLDDPNLAATVHYYGFWPFSVNVAGFTRFDAEVEQDLVDTFDRVHDAFVARGVPVIVGEYGLLGFDQHTGTVQQGEKLKFFEAFGHHARTRQLTTMLWDNGQHFHRTALQWSDPELFAQIRSSWTTRSATASADQVFLPGSGPITDRTVTLDLHGASFEGLRHGDTPLTEGTDYAFAGGQLTLTGPALTALAGSRGYGANADLHAEFSQGVPWRISVVTADPPILSDATGTTGSFAIPTQFRGDQLATMEATYSDGGNAGPHDWTPFKEFSRAFEPDRDAGAITLTADFFAEVDEGRPVDLTFHFWSGATVAYTVTVSGGTVTGTAG